MIYLTWATFSAQNSYSRPDSLWRGGEDWRSGKEKGHVIIGHIQPDLMKVEASQVPKSYHSKTRVGFKPTREEHNGLAVHPLKHTNH